MEDKIILTVFTDPMMGLSYESEPILERLQREYAEQLEIRYVMSVLVRDVSDFMTRSEQAMEPEAGIRAYCKRLAQIYKSEESIGGLPIHMEGFCLFDAEHRSSRPLCLAYKAAQLAAPEKADDFLTALRHATVLDCRPTSREEEILRIVRNTGIEEASFTAHFHDGSAEAALEQDLAYPARQSNGIHEGRIGVLKKECKIMADVYTIKVVYTGCEDRIWRELQISSNALLSQLGYTVLATFDTLAYHLFSISCDGDSYELPDEDMEISETECLFCVKLSDLNLKVGSKLEMVYDFGCEQEFSLEVVDIRPMKKGAGRAYPKITAGAGLGIIDDMPADELLELIQDIDKNGSSSFYYEAKRPEVVWDYRNYDMQLDNLLLKGEIERIAEGYSAFEAYL